MLKQIIAIRHDKEEVITDVKLKTGELEPVSKVVANIKNKIDVYKTSVGGKDGAEVILTSDGNHITTKPDGKKENNLEELPLF